MVFKFFLNGNALNTDNLFEATRSARKTGGKLECVNPATGVRFEMLY